jgi:uncharacterized RDD family membrane protein YckC
MTNNSVDPIESENIFPSFIARSIASTIDIMIFIIFFFTAIFASFLIPESFYRSKFDPAESFVIFGFIFLISIISFVIYNIFLHSSSWQATIGKKIMGIMVVDEHGRRITLKKATTRLLLGGLESNFSDILMMFGNNGRTISDKMSKTFLVKKPKKQKV